MSYLEKILKFKKEILEVEEATNEAQNHSEVLQCDEKPGGQVQTTEVTRQETEATPKPELDTVALSKMPIKDFEKAGLCLKIWSDVLQGEVLFVSDEKAIAGDLPAGAISYTAKELQVIVDQKLQPCSLQLLNEAKKIFPGAIIFRATKTQSPIKAPS